MTREEQEDAIKCFEKVAKYSKLTLEMLQNRIVTRQQLRNLFDEFDKKTWSESEDVRGDDMIEIGTARQIYVICSVSLECGTREKSRKYEINFNCYKHSIDIDNLEALRDIRSAVQLLRIYKSLFIFNQKSNQGGSR